LPDKIGQVTKMSHIRFPERPDRQARKNR